MHRALMSAIVASGMLAIAGTASAADILEDSQLDEVTAGGGASSSASGFSFALSDNGNDATTRVSVIASAITTSYSSEASAESGSYASAY